MQKVSSVYMWSDYSPQEERDYVDVTIARRGKWGYSEHSYTDITEASRVRLLQATPPKPTEIVGNVLRWEIK